MVQQAVRAGRDRTGWGPLARRGLPLSLLVHLAVLAALLFFPHHAPELLDVGESGTVDVVMVPEGVPDAAATIAPEPNPASPTPPAPDLAASPQLPLGLVAPPAAPPVVARGLAHAGGDAATAGA